MSKNRESRSSARRFGTFGGVFTPCTLTILGVIMFLRLGQVVGHSGVWLATAIVLVAAGITMLTTLSLSAIATNTRVRGGGAYYLVSRSLGSMTGAPRILQALACDDVFPWLRFLGADSGASGELRRAIVLTFLISQACILLGDLGAIAPILTMASSAALSSASVAMRPSGRFAWA